MRKNLVISGLPGSGKTTLLQTFIKKCDHKVGFVTHEILDDCKRVGFTLETHKGEKAVLASVDFKTNFQVSRYFVEIRNLDGILPSVETFVDRDVLFLDEIGQMQVLSEPFKALVEKYFNSPNLVIATLSKVYNDEWTEAIKKRDDIILIEITAEDRASKEKFLEALLKKIAKAKRYASEPARFSIGQNEVCMTTDHATRVLTRQDGWKCDCGFFHENGLCSHILALEEYLRN